MIAPPLAQITRPRRGWVTRTVAVVAAVTATLALGGCGASHAGYLAIALDPAGRLLVVVALCDGGQLASLTLTDENSGTSTTTHPTETPEPGGSLILTAPIDNPRPEGALDLLERSHVYLLSGRVRAPGADADDTDATSEVRFTLDAVVKLKALRTGSVFAGTVGSDDATGAEIAKDDFVTQATKECD